jgi:ribosomal protein S20
MPKTKSAKKALRKSKKNWEINEIRRRKMKIAIKSFLKDIKNKNKEEAKEKLKMVYKQIDKASKRFMHKNKAARLKSKYAQFLNKA